MDFMNPRIGNLYGWLDRQSWLTYYYCDEYGGITIAADGSKAQSEVERLIIDEAEKLQIEKPVITFEPIVAGRYITGADPDNDREQTCAPSSVGNPLVMTLYPGMTIGANKTSATGRLVRPYAVSLFSGSVGGVAASATYGMTVAHLFDKCPSGGGNEVFVEAWPSAPAVGWLFQRYKQVKNSDGVDIHADIALLAMAPGISTINTVTKGSKTYKLVLRALPDPRTKVIIQRCNGTWVKGVTFPIRGTYGGVDVSTALCVKKSATGMVAITAIGDSGALVLSRPKKATDVLEVYGIVTGFFEAHSRDKSFTVACRLQDDLPGIGRDLTEFKDITSTVHDNTVEELSAATGGLHVASEWPSTASAAATPTTAGGVPGVTDDDDDAILQESGYATGGR